VEKRSGRRRHFKIRVHNSHQRYGEEEGQKQGNEFEIPSFGGVKRKRIALPHLIYKNRIDLSSTMNSPETEFGKKIGRKAHR